MWRPAAGFVAGCGGVLLLPQLPSIWVLVAVAITAVLIVRTSLGAVPLAAVVGAVYCCLSAQARLADRLHPDLDGELAYLVGTVVSVPQATQGNIRFRFRPDDRQRYPALLELTWYEAQWRPRSAERLRIEAKLRRPRGFANPGGSDNDGRMLRDGVGGTGYVRSLGRLPDRPRDHWWYPVLLARDHVAITLRRILGDRPATGIVAGLSVGLQDALSREQWLALARSGTSHLMAISGLHIAMVAAVAGWLTGLLQTWRQRRGSQSTRRDAVTLVAMLTAAGYSALAGWSVPTQRTMVMIMVAFLAMRSRRQPGMADSFALCAVAVALFDPLALLAAGFWLSFGAVAAILYATAGAVRRPTLMRSYLHVQLAVTLGLTPVLIGCFGSLSLIAALVNLVAIPLYTLLIVPAVLLSTAVALCADAPGKVLLEATAALIETTWPLIAVPASWPLATWSVASPSPWGWILLLLGTVGALSPLPVRGRLAGAVLVLIGCCWRPPPLPQGALRLSVLDVGQGLAVVAQTRSHVLVYDAGPSFRSGTDTGMLVVLPFLVARGIRAIDRLVVTHDDDDHKGGAQSVLQSMPVRTLTVGPSVRRLAVPPRHPATRVINCHRGGRWRWDGVEFAWLHPGATRLEGDNDTSCVLRVSVGEHSFLLTGDIEAAAEAQLVQAGLDSVDVVVAPHHGSKTSSSAAFVEATSPRWIIYTVGYRNRWGFPRPQVVSRWEQAGAQGLLTSTSGTIEFLVRPKAALAPPAEWRLAQHRFWQDP